LQPPRLARFEARHQFSPLRISGKTTLLRVLAGLEFVDSGEVVIDGRQIHGVPARERGVGFVFQHYALFRHMTIASNIAFGLEVLPRHCRPPPRDIRDRVDAAAIVRIYNKVIAD
jgi:sulfate transport system ATP-binding protein